MLLCSAVVAFCAEPPVDRRAIVRELLRSSGLLEDTQFSIPLSLWEKYIRETQLGGPEGIPAPVPWIAEEGLYHLTVSDLGKAALKATVTYRVFRPAESRSLPVLSEARTWKKITVNDQAAKLATLDGFLRFTPDEPGVYVLSAEAPLKFYEPLTLAVPQTVRTLVRFDAHEEFEFRVEGAARHLLGGEEEGTHGQLGVTTRKQITLTYRRPAPVREHSPRFALTGPVAWNLDAGSQQVAAALDVRIIGGRADRIDLMLPAGAERVTVTGPDVRATQAANGVASVFLKGKVSEKTRLVVKFELAAGGDTKRLAGLGVRDGHWAGGTLVVTNTAGGSELLTSAVTGAQELSLSEIPPAAAAILAGPPALAYEITSRAFSAEVEVASLGEFALRESIADLALYELLYRDDGVILCKVSYEIRNRTRQFLRVDVPDAARVLQARVNDKPVPLTAISGAPDAYLLPLVRSELSVKGLVSFPVELVLMYRTGSLRRGKGEVALPLPRIDLPIAYGWCQARMPGRMQVRKWSGPLGNVQQYSSETAIAHLGYGRGELAEGYTKDGRIAAPDRPVKVPPVDHGRPGTWFAPTPAPRPAMLTLSPAELPSQPAIVSRLPVMTKPLGRDLGRNYWRSGKDLYQRGEYDKSAEALNKVIELAPKTPEADNARRLLANIDLARGKLALRSRAEKVAGAKVRRSQAYSYEDLAEKQTKMLELARESTHEGKYKQAQAQLQVAGDLSKKLLARGAESRRQSLVLHEVQESLSKVEQAEASQEMQLRAQMEQFKNVNEYGKALQAGQELRDLLVRRRGDAKELSTIQTDMERLAVAAANKEARQRRVEGYTAKLAELRKADRALGEALAGVAATRPAQRAQPAPPTDGGFVPGVAASPEVVSRLAGEVKAFEDRLAEKKRRLSALAKALIPTHTFTLKNADASAMADVLAKLLTSREIRSVRAGGGGGMLAAPTRIQIDEDRNALIVTADSATLEAVRGLLSQLDTQADAAAANVAVFPLEHADAERTATLLNSWLGGGREERYVGGGRTGAKFAVDKKSNSLIVAGPPEALERVRRFIAPLDTKAVHQAQVPWYDQLRYPRDAPDITRDRQPSGAAQPTESEAKRATGKRMRATVGSMNLSGSQFKDVVQFLRDVGNVSIYVNWGALQAAGIDKSSPVSVNLRNVTFEKGLRTVLEDVGGGQVDLRHDVDEGVITISTKDDLDTKTVTKVYDIRDLIARVPNFEGPKLSLDSAGNNASSGLFAADGAAAGRGDSRQQQVENVLDLVRGTIDRDSWANEGGTVGSIKELGGQIIVTQTAENQRWVGDLLGKLREARGPQVQYEGERFAEQRAKKGAAPSSEAWGLEPGGFEYAAGSRGRAGKGDKKKSGEFDRFIASNYGWALKRPAKAKPGGRAGALDIAGTFLDDSQVDFIVDGADDRRRIDTDRKYYLNLSDKLRLNKGQKVAVNSMNVNVDTPAANSLGINFTAGDNDTHYAVIDDAQFRTIMELEARRGGAAGHVPSNQRIQETIVGTDVLLANGMIANDSFAGDLGNTMDINGNAIDLPHEKYILISNGSYLTVMRAGQMQHWTEPIADVRFAEVPQTIDVPQVGRLVKFEKKLIQPADKLFIRASYVWKGESQ